MATISRQKTARFLIHLIFIMIIFVLPELVMNISMPNRRGASFFHIFYIKSAIFIAIFYVNFYFVIGRTIGRGTVNGIWRFIGWNILLIGVALFISTVLFRMNAPVRHRTVSPEHIHSARHALKSFSFILRDAVMMILTIALAVAIRLSDRWKMLEEHRRELHHEQKARELENLKSQLNPHFLFNTLNTIYALIDVNTDDARSAIHRLSALLRYMLYENPAEVPLARELEFIDNYIALMRLRLGDGLLDVRIDDGGHSDALVAPLLLVSLIENAVKYGNTGRPSDKIEIDIRVAHGRLSCHTFNHFLPKESSNRGAGGIGITNLRRRLHLLYGSRASLSTVVTADTYTTDLSIPLNAEIK